MSAVSEQRLRARLAALETAHMVHGFVADGHVGPMLGIAEAFEDWLMRAEPIDTTGLNEPGCSVCWRGPGDDHVHVCANPADDGDRHLCQTCGRRRGFPR